jgi:Nitrogen permease regulator 2
MVRACLRVLRHHGVIALVDMFFFSNRYECTDRAAALMLAAAAAAATSSSSNNHQEERSAAQQQQQQQHQQAVLLLNDAVDFCVRSRQQQQLQFSSHSAIFHSGGGGNTNNNSRDSSPSLMAQQSPASSYMLEQHQKQQQRQQEQQRQQQQQHRLSDGMANAMNRRDDSYYQELKAAVAELYCSCHRNQSIGEMWISLCEGGGRQQQHHRTGQTKAWRKIFRDIDHGRFVSFGLVHGLIRRVHNFPYFLNAPEACLDGNRKHQQHPAESSSLFMDQVLGPRYDRIRSSSGGLRNNDATREDLRTLPTRVASFMDGKNCDDDLVCEFNRSFEELLDIVGKANVASVYATLDSP